MEKLASSVMDVAIQPRSSPKRVIRTAYGPRRSVALKFSGDGRTKQSFKDECDINRIMARYMATGVLPELRDATQAQYADCTVLEYQSAMELVANANSLFAELPATVRDRFENEPRKLLEFVQDPANLDESIELGFIDARKLPAGFSDAAKGVVAPPPAAAGPGASGPAPGGSGGQVSPRAPRSAEGGPSA